MIPAPLDNLIKQLGRMPGLGRRSAQRAALHLMANRDDLSNLVENLQTVAAQVTTCHLCGNVDLQDPCAVCADETRDASILCVVEEVADLWAMERSGAYTGHYHVLGGVLSALDGIGPEDLRLKELIGRVDGGPFTEVILALSASVDGQTTSHFIAQKLEPMGVNVTSLAKGMPMGAGVDYMDEGTLSLALQGRKSV